MKAPLLIKASKIDQLVNKEIYLAKMNIVQLNDIIKYTNRKSNDQYIDVGVLDIAEEYKYYQRIKNGDRAYQIKLFFLKHIWNKYFYEQKRISPLGTFPSSIILAFNSFDSNSHEEFNSYILTDGQPELIFIEGENEKILIPKANQGLIVDGQHRIAGLQLLWEEVLAGEIHFKKANAKDYYAQKGAIPKDYMLNEILNFNFIISILTDFDLYEQSEIFATVNFNQQRVNKSFYYDIFGTANTGKTIEKLLHDIASNLNYKEDSPLYRKIKMLGSGEGYFSQAFLVDALIPHFKQGVFQFVYTDFQKDGLIYKKIPDFLKSYFQAVFEVFDRYLPKKDETTYKNNLLKTTGMGALILLLPKIFNEIKNQKQISNSEDVLLIPKEELTILIEEKFRILDDKGPKLFSESGDYSKGSGKGLQNKLFEAMNNDLFPKNTAQIEEEPLL
jgi:hypothetical protein